MQIDKPTKPFAWVDEEPAVVAARKCRANNWRGFAKLEDTEINCASAKAKGVDKDLKDIEQTVD